MGGIAPYLFVVMALISTGMWGANVVRAKSELKPVVEQMKRQHQINATEQQQRNEDIFAPA
jgi:heme exporter protein D